MTSRNDERRRPYLSGRRCGRCLLPLETSELRQAGWLFVTFTCPGCGFRQVVTFSPGELEEWARRQARGNHESQA